MPDLTLFALPAFTLATLWFGAGAAMPWLMLYDRFQAVKRGRSLYEKSGLQLAGAAFALQALWAAALGADVLFSGAMAGFFKAGLWNFGLALLGGSLAAAIFSGLAFFCLRKESARAWGWRLTALSALAGLIAVLASLFPAWLYTHGFWGGLGEGEGWLAVLRAVLATSGPEPYVFAGLWLVLPLAASQGLALCRHILRRKADDYGRDFYAFAVSRRARLAAYAGALPLPFAAGLLWLRSGVLAGNALPLLPPVSPLAIHIASLGLLLAAACWYATARSQNPLRLKTLMFLAPLLLGVGVWAVLAKLWW